MTDDVRIYLAIDEHGRPYIDDTAIEKIAKKAAKATLNEVYAEIGRSVAKRIFWLIGVAVVGGLLLIGGKNALDHIKPGAP